jgi:hypothetical protein
MEKVQDRISCTEDVEVWRKDCRWALGRGVRIRKRSTTLFLVLHEEHLFRRASREDPKEQYQEYIFPSIV